MQKNVLLILLLALLLPSVAFSQGKRRAVVVGVASFEFGYASLDYTARDARRTASALEDLGYSVSLLAADADAGEVKYPDVLAALRRAAANCQAGDTLLFFFAGHGSRRMDKDYLLLSDSDPGNFAATALAFDTLSEIAAASKATRRIFVIDACRNTSERAGGKPGFTDGKLDKNFKDTMDKLTAKTAPVGDVQTAVLYACSPGETSKENIEERAGIFTQRFVHALQQPEGAAPLTLGGVLAYIRAHMPATIEQNPLLVGAETIPIGPSRQRTAPNVERPTAPASTNRPRVMVNSIDGAEMVFVPGGEFTMGDPDSFENRNPVHQATISSFHVYKIPVTVAQYRRFCDATGHPMPPTPPWGWKDDHPVINVTWDDAQAYCKWAGVRLPTEAEWEMAARGTDRRKYPWGNTFDAAKLCSSVPAKRTSTVPAGSYPAGASPCGALDITGNVWQWCSDWYDVKYTRISNLVNPTGPASGTERVLRGGSWFNENLDFFRTSCRILFPPKVRTLDFGFRCVSDTLAP